MCFSTDAKASARRVQLDWMGATARCHLSRSHPLYLPVLPTALFHDMFFMRILGCLSVLILALAVVAEDAPTELKIDTTYVPDDCKVKSQNGDKLQVHYVSFHKCFYQSTGR